MSSVLRASTGVRIRWYIFGLVFAFAVVKYFQWKELTIAAARIMPELRLSQFQIGWLEQAFVLGYTLFQLPGGLIGQRVGARVATATFASVALCAIVATAAAPEVFHGTSLFICLLTTQFVLGTASGGQGPVSIGVSAAWFPSRQWPLAIGLASMGLQVGAALCAPLIAAAMESFGWQRAIAWACCPALLLIVAWYWFMRNTPQEHPRVSKAELAELDQVVVATVERRRTAHQILSLLADRSVVLLALSYIAMNYSFYLLSNWCFLYLIQERHFSLMQSGWLATAPPLAAGLGAGIGGALPVRLCARFGIKWGYRVVPMLALPAAGLLLLWAVFASNAYSAVAALTACFWCVELTEGSFWGATMNVGRGATMAVSGVVNTAGNLGGIIGIPIVAYLSGQQSWITVFVIGSISAVSGAVMWLGIDASNAAIPVRGA